MGRKKMTVKELQQVELDILSAFHQFCVTYGLKYYLGGGSALGAVRHHGFIPWDDDIDVIMPRPDYMKFLSLTKVPGTLGENYKVSNYYTDRDLPVQASTARIFDTRTEVIFDNFRIPFSIGCWVDIFAIDGLPSSTFSRNTKFKIIRLLLDLLYCDVTKFGGKRRSRFVSVMQFFCFPIVLIAHIIGYRRIIELIERIALKDSYENSEWVGVLEGRAVEKEAMIKAELEPPILAAFEGHKFYLAANYDTYLSNLYGDYMTPPKEENRVSRHEINVYWKDNKEA